MRALVTGSRGFIGRHMMAELFDRGYEITGWDLAAGHDCRDLFRAEPEHWDLVVHCAAHVGGRVDIDSRAAFIGAYNSELDAAMFRWALDARPGRIVYFSSSAAYPEWLQDSVGTPLREDAICRCHPHESESSYGQVKLHGEYLASLVREAGTPVSVFRPFSGYGTDQSTDYPFPAFIRRALAREDPFTVWGPGTQVRDFVHVDDIVATVLAAVETGHDGPLNIGTGYGISFLELAKLVATIAGYDPQIQPQSDKPTGVMHRVADVTQLVDLRRPRISLGEGIQRALNGEP
jgi:nucleoside-diphosphate-sugar epimerase